MHPLVQISTANGRTVMIRSSAAALIHFCSLKGRCLFETGLTPFFKKQSNVQNKTIIRQVFIKKGPITEST